MVRMEDVTKVWLRKRSNGTAGRDTDIMTKPKLYDIVVNSHFLSFMVMIQTEHLFRVY